MVLTFQLQNGIDIGLHHVSNQPLFIDGTDEEGDYFEVTVFTGFVLTLGFVVMKIGGLYRITT